VWLRVQNVSFEDFHSHLYDQFTLTLERIQLLYVNPGTVKDNREPKYVIVLFLQANACTLFM